MDPNSYITDPISIIYELHEWLTYNITQCQQNLKTYAKPKHTKIYEKLAAYQTVLDKLEDLIDDYSN